MPYSSRKYLIVIICAVSVLLIGAVLTWIFWPEQEELEYTQTESESEAELTNGRSQVIGSSVEGRDIVAYSYGSGDTRLLFVGGVHGGYEWNSTLLAYTFIDYITDNPDVIPSDLTVTVVPSLNPDGTYAVLGISGRFALSDVPEAAGAGGAGRFNANRVDLNRNFDCKWQPESSWRGEIVSAGAYAFSEPEAVALRDFVNTYRTKAVVFWHSQANTVYASECEDGVLPETVAIMTAYANAAQYNSVEKFDAYPITGDAEGYLASIGIPAITVEMETHETIEWTRNLAGINALLNYYSQAQ